MTGSSKFTAIVESIRTRTGIVFDADRQAKLLLPRLKSCMRQHEIDDMSDALRLLEDEPDGVFVTDLIDRIVVSESLFFRDRKLFDHLRDQVIPKLVRRCQDNGRSTCRIWSAACAHGQEPYSFAVMWRELAGITGKLDLEIYATDISNGALQRAREGDYSQFEAQRGLPILYLIRYFVQQGDRWIIDGSFRNMVQFHSRNLLDDFSDLQTFDLIFCRNVLLYFDRPTKTSILTRMTQVLQPNGHLIVGGAESVLGLVNGYTRIPDCAGVFELNHAGDGGGQASNQHASNEDEVKESQN